MSAVVLGQRYQTLLDRPLRELGLTPLYLPENPRLDPRLAAHADLSLFRAGERIWLSPSLSSTRFHEKLHNLCYSVIFPNILEGNIYPRDAGLNLLALGKRLLYSPKASAPDIVKFLTISGSYQPIPVKQGYLRCSALPVNGDSLITADPGIAAAAEQCGIEVLRIFAGHVTLPGYAYGFLGGAGFQLDAKNLALTGSLDKHPDREGSRLFWLTGESRSDI